MRVHPRVMRHTFATTLLDKGNDLKRVHVLMGHFHIRTTETYLYSTDDRKGGNDKEPSILGVKRDGGGASLF